MTRAIQKDQRDNVRITKTADALILTNERTGESVTVPPDASAWQKREAVKRLQPQRDTTYDQPLVPKGAKRETPLPVPTTPGILARKRERENAEHSAKIQAAQDRAQKLADDRRNAERTAELTADKLAARILQSESQPEPAPVDLGDVIKRRWDATAALTKLRADPNANADALAAAEKENAEAWGFSAPESEGGANE